ATGCFQNLFTFKHLLLRFNAISFCFFSHKVLRWMGPLLFFTIYLASCVLALHHHEFFQYAFYVESALITMVPIDYLLQKSGLHLRLLRLIRHFFFMNLAIFIGMFKAMRGVKSSIWEPTQRHQ